MADNVGGLGVAKDEPMLGSKSRDEVVADDRGEKPLRMISITGHGSRKTSGPASDVKIHSSQPWATGERTAMPPNETLVNRVRTAIGQSRRVEEKKMFGGIAFMVEGKMCVSVGKGRIMCRIDPATHDEALRRKGCTTVVMRGREYRGYVRIAGDALSTKSDLDYWVRLALDFNSRAKASTRKRH